MQDYGKRRDFMAQWKDVYFRENSSDKGENPAIGSSACFDIITKQEPLADPSILIGADRDKNNSESMNARMNNYIYVRGNNNAGKEQSGQVYLYYAPASLLLYPMIWKDNVIKLGGGKDHFDFSVKSGNQFVCWDDTQGGFFWNPQMIYHDHYCLISRAVTKDHPAEIPKASDIESFGKFISTNRSYGWRNVTVTDRNTADFSQTVDYDQGGTAYTMHIILTCKDAPVGAEVAFDCPTQGPKPLIHMKRTKITTPNQDLGLVCNVPANFNGKITYYYWANGKKPGDNFSLELHCVVFTASDNVLYPYARHYEELGFKLPRELRAEMRIGDSIGPERALILGQYSTQMKG